MSASLNLYFGFAFVIIGAAAVALQAWLWRFPMVPDPSGRDPHGVSTAPRGWTNVHRALGYLFAAIYLVMLWSMVPRIWQYRVGFTSPAIMHAALGFLIGVVLFTKISIIRKFPKWGGSLPYLGGTMLVSAIFLMALQAPNAMRANNSRLALANIALARQVDPGLTKQELEDGRTILMRKCIQCHGLSTVLQRNRSPRGWEDIVEEMSEKRGAKIRITGADIVPVASYLSAIASAGAPGESEDENENENEAEGGRRGRGRGRHD